MPSSPIIHDTDTGNMQVCQDCIKHMKVFEMLADDDESFFIIEGDAVGTYQLVFYVSDVFRYASGDLENIPWELVDEVYDIHKEQGYFGMVAWVAKRRGVKPVVETVERMQKEGVQLPDGLKDNPENEGGRRW